MTDAQDAAAGRRPPDALGPYEVRGPVAGGGMGEVYRAYDPRLGRDVAIKVIRSEVEPSPDRLRRFEQEARAVAALNHPNILTVHDVGSHEGRPYLVLELLEGETVRAHIERGPLPLTRAVEVAVQACRGLDAAHARGLVHRDLKPENLFLTTDGRLKVLDFGLAKLARGDEADPLKFEKRGSVDTDTAPGTILGTLSYLSPEQARGLPADARSDVFALGAVLYEMLSGRRAFSGDSPADTISAILHRDPPPLLPASGPLPVSVERIVRRCLEKNPGQRFHSAHDLALALESVLGRSEAGPREQAPPEPKRHPGLPAFRRRWAIGAFAAGATLLAIGAYLTAVRLRPASRPERTLTRLTFEPGFQHAPTWSPDGRFIAYGSAGPTQDVWVQPVAGGNPVQVTKHPGRDWQPDWSPDGTQIVFRSEREGGGLFVVPMTGGHERKLTGSGYYPHFSPDGSRVLFSDAFIPTRLSTVALDGSPPRELAPELSRRVERVFGGWHPDGRVSISTLRRETEWGFWTLPLSGGPAVQSELAPDVKQRFEAAGLQPFFADFAWAPSGDAIFFSAAARGMRSIFKVTVDAGTLRWTAGPQQLTFGPGDDTEVAVSADGRKLAFNVTTETTRLWAFPFDPVRRRVAGAAQPLTPDGWLPANAGLSVDGRKLAFMARRRGERAARYELWQKLLSDGSEKVLLADASRRGELRWSPDGARIAFSRDGKAIMIYDTRAAEEQPLASAAGRELWVTDWSPDGRAIMASGPGEEDPNRYVLWLFPVSPEGQPTGPGRLVASHRDYGIYQTDVAPDGRWICFEAVRYPDSRTATLYVVRPTGGAWIPVTDGRHWDDAPRWAPDGRTIYFLSNRAADAFFLHLWAVRFDPDAGRIVGEPFQVPEVEVPDHFMALVMGPSLEIAVDRLVMSLGTISGNVWMLDNVDRY